jgi:acyl-CoA thioesterase
MRVTTQLGSDSDRAQPSPPDSVAELLGLDVDRPAGQGRLVVGRHLLNSGGSLWGGCGLSAAIAVGETVLGRGCLWATVQYVSPIAGGERLDLAVEVGRHGRGLSQVAVRGTVGDRLALLATGTFGGAGETAEQFVRPPADVPPPEECPVRTLPDWLRREGGMLTRIEQRSPWPSRTVLDGTRGTGRTALWMRLRGARGGSPAALAILADLAPSVITEGMGTLTFARSLDNSIRMACVSEADWVLLDIQFEAALRNVAQLNARMFDRDGRLLAIAGQSARMGRAPAAPGQATR